MTRSPWRSHSIILMLVALAICGCGNNRALTVQHMLVEYEENPLGIDVQQPRLSWILSSNQRGVSQTAYRILVAENPESLTDTAGNLWDSGKVNSAQSNNVVYGGESLTSGTTYYWKVQVWNQDDESAWSETGSFHTGLMNASDWEAGWISVADSAIAAPLLRKAFEVQKRVQSAYAYVTGIGYYELYLNGEKVGDHVLDPAMTDYSKRVLYSTYDVTDLLDSGSNAAGIILGNGAYRMERMEGRYAWGRGGNILGIPRAILQLDITYTDGTEERIITDGSWQSSASPITFNNLYGGEDYDARLERPGWSTASFDASDWDPVIVVDSPGGVMDAQTMPPIKVTQTIQPVAETQPEEGVYLFDMGQNLPGWWRIRAEGDAGIRLRVRGSETLNDSLFPTPLQPGDTLNTGARYHAGVWTDYTLKGDGLEVYEPRFFYTAYRYVEVAVSEPENLESLDVEGRVVHTALENNGVFTTSDELLNGIHQATVWSQIGNSHGYPTDCPHREKGGYTGDGQVIAEASIHDFHMPTYYTKWLNDMRDAQEEDGRIPNTSPELVGGMGGGIAWGSAYVLLPWWMYQYYNDTRIMEQHYPTMQLYHEYLYNLARTDANPDEPYIINDFGSYWFSLGEWCAPGERDGPNHPVVSTYYYYWDTVLLSRIAAVLGMESDASRYASLADTIKQAFNEKFLNPETNLYGTDSTYQTYQLLALAGNATPEGQWDAVLQTLIDDIVNVRDGHLNTGIIGTKHLWQVLANAGHSDVAYTVATQTTYPSYGYWLENGATTLWENWEGTASHNHQMFGSVDEFFYKYLAGINAPTDGTTSRGYKQITVQPYVPDDLEWVEASIETVAGEVTSRWENGAGVFRLQVTIPANTTGTIKLPTFGQDDIVVTESRDGVWEDGSYVSGVNGVTGASADDQWVTFSVESGTYDFSLERSR